MLDLTTYVSLTLWNEWNSLLKNKNRASDAGGKRGNFLAKFDCLFDIGSSDAIQKIRKSGLDCIDCLPKRKIMMLPSI